MSRPGSRRPDRVPPSGRRAGLAAGAALLGALAGGCAAAPTATYGAHVAFLTPPACPTFVANTVTRGYALMTAEPAEYAAAVGDVLEGPTRPGRSVFRYYPYGDDATRQGGRDVTLDVVAVDLPLAEARARLDAACGPGATASSPGP